MPVCLSIGGQVMFSSKAPSPEVLVGTVKGVFTIEKENSGKWHVSSNTLENSHIHAIVVEPSSGMAFAGVQHGSVYASRDLGKTWELRDKGLTQNNIYCLNFCHVNGRVKLYAGTEPAHLFESDNLGETWSELSSLRSVPSVPQWTFPAPPHDAHVKNVGFDPHDPHMIYACIEQGGLLRSRDAGVSWEELHGFEENLPFEMPEGAAADDVHRIVIPPSKPRWLYTSGGVGICLSRDAGENWERLTNPYWTIGYADALFIHPRREELMFTAGAAQNPGFWRKVPDADAKIARSRDGGRSWEILRRGLPEHMKAHVAAMTMELWNGSFALFAGTTDGAIYYSDDEGEQWTKIIDGLPPISKGRHYASLGAGRQAAA